MSIMYDWYYSQYGNEGRSFRFVVRTQASREVWVNNPKAVDHERYQIKMKESLCKGPKVIYLFEPLPSMLFIFNHLMSTFLRSRYSEKKKVLGPKKRKNINKTHRTRARGSIKALCWRLWNLSLKRLPSGLKTSYKNKLTSAAKEKPKSTYLQTPQTFTKIFTQLNRQLAFRYLVFPKFLSCQTLTS